MKRRLWGAAVLAGVALLGAQAPSSSDDLLQTHRWRAAPADGVELRLSPADGPAGRAALRMEYDFHGRGGWAAARRELELELPAYYEIRLLLRGAGPRNHLELKLVDPTGDNVWWHVRRDVEWPGDWSPLRVQKRQVSFAWGPAGGGELRRLAALELTVTAGEGGRGWIEVAGLEIVPREPPVAAGPRPASATASDADPAHPAAAAVDGDPRSVWRPAGDGAAELVADLGGPRELGGVTLVWAGREAAPRRFTLEHSRDGRDWTLGREVTRGGAARSHLQLPETETRHLRVRLPSAAGCAERCALAELVVRPLAFGASANDLSTTLAAEAPRGTYPRGFSEAVYWTVAGVDGDREEALLSEDGAVELGERGPSLEPFLHLGGELVGWAEVTSEQTLADGDLPIPSVAWSTHDGVRVQVTVLAGGEAGASAVLVRYRVTNESTRPARGRLLVAARPFQVNPAHQFLNVTGGVAPIGEIACARGEGAALLVDGTPRVWAAPVPVACGAQSFDEGPLVATLAGGSPPVAQRATDPLRLASAALAWELDLAAGEERVVVLAAPLSGDGGAPLAALAATTSADTDADADADATFAAFEVATRSRWRQALDRVGVDLPPAAAPLAALLRSNLAWALVHRDGPALQPGSRAYARSWIRDGALTGAALLRLGHADVARDFAEWFAGFQYPDGKVPCCVDRRGADPVPEHDSHGQLVHLVAEVWRHTGDVAFLDRLFPHVERAVGAIETLRQQRRTAAYRAPDQLAFFGLLPPSISHEGYSARPVHSYWDDTFAYRGLDDAVALARARGREDLAIAWAARRDELRADLLASIDRVRAAHGLAWIPGSADLADFDSTSTTTLLEPGGLLPYLPRDAVEATFERYWRDFAARRDGERGWETYTPYELRHLGAFARLAVAEPHWRARAHEALTWFRLHLRPPAWHGWAEAVHREPRAPRFLGDLPHGWVGSDYARSLLDLLAFERREDGALVLAAGVPPEWLAPDAGVGLRALRTPWGALSYRLARIPGGHRFTVSGELAPPGGLVLVAPERGPHLVTKIAGRVAPLPADGLVAVPRAPVTVDILQASREELHGH